MTRFYSLSQTLWTDNFREYLPWSTHEQYTVVLRIGYKRWKLRMNLLLDNHLLTLAAEAVRFGRNW